MRGDPFSPKAQVRAARADSQRARRVFVRDPLSLDGGDLGSSESSDSEGDAEPGGGGAAAAAARRTERAAARRDAETFASIDRRDRAETHHHVFGLKLKALADAYEADPDVRGGASIDGTAFDATDAGTNVGKKDDAATRRMEDAVGLALLWCGSAFRVDAEYAAKKRTDPSANPPPCPPLGTHAIRRTALDADPRTVDLYVQDQCSYLYDHAVRTVDHFVDGARQKIHASAKFAFAPRAEPRGAAVLVALDPPAPFKWARSEGETASEKGKGSAEPGREEGEGSARADSGSDSDSFVVVSPPAETEGSGTAVSTEASADASRSSARGDARDEERRRRDADGSRDDKKKGDVPPLPRDELPPWTRQGSFVELGGCSGHPDYLRRVPAPAREPEVYEIERFPALRFERFVKSAPTARFVGEMRVVCRATRREAVVRFRPYDAAFAERTGVRGNVVSGAVYESRDEAKQGRGREKVLRVVLGTTDGDVESSRVVFAREASRTAGDANEGSNIRSLIRGMAPYSNASRGGFDARAALRTPGVMAQRRFWHAVVDAMHARDLREPLNSVKYELLQPLRRCAALLILGRDEKYIGAEPKAPKATRGMETTDERDEGRRRVVNESSFSRSCANRDNEVGRRMRYEGAFLLTGALPEGSPGPLPRFWKPQPTRRMRR